MSKLQKFNKVSTPENIKASPDTQIGKVKNASINVKFLTVAHEILSYTIMNTW